MASHPIVHVEIATNDPRGSGAFYGDLFGWNIRRDEGLNYTMWSGQDGPGGGFSAIGEYGIRQHDTLVYVATDDVDATLSKVEQLGGRVIMPATEIPGTGWMAIFEDPYGGRIGLYKDVPR
jgi:uncharacterized protein